MLFSLPLFALAVLAHSVCAEQEDSSVSSLRGSVVGAVVDASVVEDHTINFDDPMHLEDDIETGDDVDDIRRRLGLSDWTMCLASSQCNNGCCSGKYSGGVLKCTPLTGGYRSDICVGGATGPAPAPTPPTSTTGSLSDWTQCSSSSQCRNGCCSGTYSGGVLMCTPLNGGYRSDICVGSGTGTGPAPGPSPSPPTSPSIGSGGSALLTGSGSGTYYYDITGRMCNGISTSDLNKAYPKCTSNNPAYYKTLGQYGTNNIIAIDNNLLNAPGGREKYCGKQVRVYRNGVEVPGPFVIMDGCPSCGSTKLDFSLTALDRISGGNACQIGNVGGLSWSVTSNQIIPFVP